MPKEGEAKLIRQVLTAFDANREATYNPETLGLHLYGAENNLLQHVHVARHARDEVPAADGDISYVAYFRTADWTDVGPGLLPGITLTRVQVRGNHSPKMNDLRLSQETSPYALRLGKDFGLVLREADRYCEEHKLRDYPQDKKDVLNRMQELYMVASHKGLSQDLVSVLTRLETTAHSNSS